MNTTTVQLKTKISKNDADGKLTTLTINWDVTDDQIRTLAQRSVVIQYQGILRAAGKIPATEALNVSSLLVRQPRTVKTLTPAEILEMMRANPELAKLLK